MNIPDRPLSKLVDNTKSKAIGKLTETLPPELQPYKDAVGAVLKGDIIEAIIKVALKLLPLIGIAIAVIIVGFIIKWWVGLLAIPCVIIWLIYRILMIINGIRKFTSSLPVSIIDSIIDIF